MNAPVNVKLITPTVTIPNWDQEAKEWMRLNEAARRNPGFYPLTVKAAYVIGVIHDICESVSHLLAHPRARTTTYIPAYGVFASGIELLGRCVDGNFTISGNVADLKTGFKWLASPLYNTVDDSHILITTSSYAYSIEMLVALRHFAAHGQATSRVTAAGTYQFGSIDYEILSKMPPLIANGLERYWDQLLKDEEFCNRLATANVIALRSWPVFKSWVLFEKDKLGKYPSITEIFNRFDWQIDSCNLR
ncbi:MAG: hypothetical protein H5T63_07740 [Chloroflexi bacterium]|nr:hypothetical protein [Chloroflexota bacterium]